MKETRTKRQSEAASEASSWVNKSRKLEKERVLQRSKIFEEQDNIAVEGSDDIEDKTHHTDHLAGVKVLHGLDKVAGESRENKVVFTEMEEFVWGLHIDEEARKTCGWTEVKETIEEEQPNSKDKEIVPDETIREVALGKGLSGALKLLKDRGTLKESIEWGGRNMDKKKSKLVGIVDDHGKEAQNKKEIHIERTDEFGRILTPKEAFRLFSHKFHGEGPGKMKQEKRMKQYYKELKMKK